MNPDEGNLLNISPELLAKLRDAAQEDNRTPDELADEALARYLEERSWQRLYAYGEERARSLGLTEKDVPRLIAEYRQRNQQRHER